MYIIPFKKVEGFENYEIDEKKLHKQRSFLINRRKKDHPNFKDVPNKILIIGNSYAKDTFNALHQNIDGFEGFDFLVGPIIRQLNCFNENVSDYEKKIASFYRSNLYKAATKILVSTLYREKRVCIGKQKSSDLDGLKFLIMCVKDDGKKIVIMGTVRFKKYNKKWATDHVYNLYKDDEDFAFEGAFMRAKDEADSLLFQQLDERNIKLTQKVRRIAEANKVAFFDKFPLICDATNGRVMRSHTMAMRYFSTMATPS